MSEASLLDWYERVRRPLPWRTTRDPYALLVSEVMLQQTQAARVVPYYTAFLARFPDPAALAAAPTRDVLAAWSGLGYNRRALALRAAAGVVAVRGWPDDLTELPGVGPYTAAAIASFAWDVPRAAIDVNVRRVIERWDGRRHTPRALAQRCDACPVAASCASAGLPPISAVAAPRWWYRNSLSRQRLAGHQRRAFATFAPGTDMRRRHLRDEQEFIGAAKDSRRRCKLKPVSIIKPIGAENEHPGYASEHTGSDHLVDLLKTVHGSRCAKDTMVVVTYDEFGGQWDHVPPPGQGTATRGPSDEMGPSTRIPALVLAPGLKRRAAVDHASHDTTSIMATIEHRYDLKPVGTRDAAVQDLSTVFGGRRHHGHHRR